jgi:L-arabinose isomerase
MIDASRPRVAAIALTLELYRESLSETVREFQAQFLRFQKEIGSVADVVSGSFCCVEQEVTLAVEQAEEDNVDALLLVPMSYTASLMPMPPLLATDLPIVIWNTQEARTVEPTFSFDDLALNHVTQGTQDLTNVLLRNRRAFGIASGHYRDKEALADLGLWLRAAAAAQRARSIRVGLLGKPFEGMGDFDVDGAMMMDAWGPETVSLPLDRFIQYLDEVDEDEIETVMARDRETYDVDNGVTPKIHGASVRLELALRRLVEENRLAAFTMNFHDLIVDGRAPTLPFLGMNKLTAEGLGVGGEGDTMTSAHNAQMNVLCGRSTFTEIYTLDYERDRMVMTHMQECNPAMARTDRKVRLVHKPFWAPGVEPYVGMHFTLEPGPVTLTALNINEEGRFFYAAHEASVVDMAPFADYDAPHWMAQLEGPVGEFLTRYSLAGGPHHLIAARGHCAELLRRLAHLQGFPFRAV